MTKIIDNQKTYDTIVVKTACNEIYFGDRRDDYGIYN